VSVTVFPKLYELSSELLEKNDPFFIVGKLDKERDPEKPQVVADDIKLLEEVDFKSAPTVHINLELEKIAKAHLSDLKNLLIDHGGKSPVCLHLNDNGSGRTSLQVDRQLSVDPSPRLTESLTELFGENCCEIEEPV
jgi:DNA polymerase III alpha subunit